MAEPEVRSNASRLVELAVSSRGQVDKGVGIVLQSRPLTVVTPSHVVAGLLDGTASELRLDGRNLGPPEVLRCPSAARDELSVLRFARQARIKTQPIPLARRSPRLEVGASVVLLCRAGTGEEVLSGEVVQTRDEGDQGWLTTNTPVGPGKSGSALLSRGRLVAVCQGMVAAAPGVGNGIFCRLAPATLRELAALTTRHRARRLVPRVAAAFSVGALTLLQLAGVPADDGIGRQSLWTALSVGRPPQPTTVEVAVSAEICGWQHADVALAAGDRVTFAASGEIVHWLSSDGSEAESCGPEGDGPGACDVPTSRCCLAPGLPDASLVGRIGDSPPFYIGQSKEFVASAPGELYLGINETACSGGCSDNSGSWAVRVTVSKD